MSKKIKKSTKPRASRAKVVIEFKKVTKIYKLYRNDREKLLAMVWPGRKLRTKLANDNVSFRIKRGESVAVLGKNGAGKSTLLKLVTQVSFPTSGQITVRGQVSAILELTAGFDEALTGRENIYLKGAILGLDKGRIRDIEQDIVAFAELNEYIDQPVRTYSSGMKARLGFAINAHIDPDILIIDEALSVGDKDFRKKCRTKVAEIRNRQHVTVLLVTHSADSAREFCERGLILHEGKLIFDGPIAEALERYESKV